MLSECGTPPPTCTRALTFDARSCAVRAAFRGTNLTIGSKGCARALSANASERANVHYLPCDAKTRFRSYGYWEKMCVIASKPLSFVCHGPGHGLTRAPGQRHAECPGGPGRRCGSGCRTHAFAAVLASAIVGVVRSVSSSGGAPRQQGQRTEAIQASIRRCGAFCRLGSHVRRRRRACTAGGQRRVVPHCLAGPCSLLKCFLILQRWPSGCRVQLHDSDELQEGRCCCSVVTSQYTYEHSHV